MKVASLFAMAMVPSTVANNFSTAMVGMMMTVTITMMKFTIIVVSPTPTATIKKVGLHMMKCPAMPTESSSMMMFVMAMVCPATNPHVLWMMISAPFHLLQLVFQHHCVRGRWGGESHTYL
ncbi:hypothetical protein NMG60_11031769 [Bertholletia excelsa]